MSAPTVTIRLDDGNSDSPPSYIGVDISGTSVLNTAGTTTAYEGWCLDPLVSINVPGTYTAYMFSSYDIAGLHAALPALGGTDPIPGHPGAPEGLAALDQINWLLNQYPSSGV